MQLLTDCGVSSTAWVPNLYAITNCNGSIKPTRRVHPSLTTEVTTASVEIERAQPLLVGHTRPHDLARCHPATQASDPGLAVVESTAFQPCLRPLVVSATLYAMLLHRCHLCPNSLETGRCSRTFVPTSYGLCDCEDASAHACDSVLEKKARRRVESVCHARKHQSTQLAMAAGMLRGDPGNQYHARFRAKTTIQ